MANATLLTANTGDAQDALAKLYDHFSGDSAHFEADNPEGGDGSGGFTLKPLDGDEAWNAVVNVSSGMIRAGIDPKGEIDDAGQADGSEEWSGLVDVSDPNDSDHSDRFYLLEWPDAFAVLFQDDAEDDYPVGFHLGRLFVPFYKSDPSRGVDGLAVLGGEPGVCGHDSASNIEDQWLNGWGYDSYGGTVRIGPTSWDTHPIARWYDEHWEPGVFPSTTLDGDATPLCVPMYSYTESHPLGVMKYLRVWDSEEPAKTRLQGGEGHTYLFTGAEGYGANTLIEWDEQEIPV